MITEKKQHHRHLKSPFKLLDAYELTDYDVFFGREMEKRELYDLVTQNRITFVYGPSGTGKTSLIQCGLAGRFDASDWFPIFIRRGNDFNASLQHELAKLLPPEAPFNGNFSDSIRYLFNTYLRPIYLIFDQFEEVFILGDNQHEQHNFYVTLTNLLNDNLPCRIILILREEYFGHLNQLEKKIPDLYQRKLRVEPMSRENLRQVVIKSCTAYNIVFDAVDRDADQIVDNIFAERLGIHMPYVQVYLDMLYREAAQQQQIDTLPSATASPSVRFDQHVIGAVGVIQNVLGRFLREQDENIQLTLTENGLNPPEDVVKQVLDVFVTQDGTKHPVPYSLNHEGTIQLKGKGVGLATHLSPQLLTNCILELEQSRILRRTEDYIELAHDSLAAIVDQQRSAEQRHLMELRRRVEIGFNEHRDSNGTFFFDQGQLSRIEPYQNKLALEPEYADFLEKSKAHIDLEETNERERLTREMLLVEERLRAEQEARKIAQEKISVELKSRKKRSKLLVVLGILLLFTAVSALWASRENFKYKNLVSKFTALNIKNANEHIQNLEYDKAHEILMKSLFFTKTDQEAVATALMETAFFYAETTKSAYRGWQVLDTIATVLNKKELLAGHKRDLTGFHQVLNDLNPNQEEWLMKRYFPVMVMVKGGTYTLIDTDRTDTITVTLSTYQIGETEVTRWQYFLYCKSTGVKFPTTWLYDGSKPITYVCWLDALKYANWLSKRMNYTEVYSDSLFMELDKNKNLTLEDSLKLLESIPYYPTANGYRLPTEAQWEFAANEGHPSVKYRYAGSNTLNDVAWNRSNSNDILQPVKTKNPNKLGLFDMTGNVMEWCWDWYDQYSLDNHENPTGPSSGTLKVVRGASKNEYQEQSVINKRQRKLPYFKDRGILGFRLARNVEK